ncbi:hypothetical protein BGZ68_001695 [Mortierella alpina]|nr:hypothetical protein BGZ68_001695 [Mortierella alpina]
MYDLKNLITGKKSVALGNISPEKMTLWRVFSVSKAREGVIILDEIHYKVKLVAGMGHDVLYYFNGCLNDNDIHVVIQRLH